MSFSDERDYAEEQWQRDEAEREGRAELEAEDSFAPAMTLKDSPDPMYPEGEPTGRYMMATTAHHQLGDISRDEPDLAWIEREDGDDWIGNWVEGYGYINVRFPKTSTRELTEAERERFNGRLLETGGTVERIEIASAPIETPEESAAIVDHNLRAMGCQGLDDVPPNARSNS